VNRRIVTGTRLAILALGAAGCAAGGPDFSFAAPEDLLPAPAAGEPIATADVAVAGGRLLVSLPFAGSVRALSCQGSSCDARPLGDGLGLPVRADVADLGGAAEPSTLVADVGSLVADDTALGRVLAIDAAGRASTVLEGLGRTVCAHGADLDGDGRTDVLACVFGNQKGELIWAQRLADGTHARRVIDPVAGVSEALAFDADGDGDLDVAAVISQKTEEVRLYRNDGHGAFTAETVFHAGDACYGLSNLTLADLDQDGDLDLLATNGDDMDDECHGAFYRGQHGLAWFENDGRGRFTRHDLLGMYGAYAVRAADLDGDGDLDLVLASYGWDPGYRAEAGWSSLIWLENDGAQGFTRREVAGAPGAVISIAVTDVDGDGAPDLVSGSMNGEEPMPGARPLSLFRGRRGAR